jgi:drug/metabolite transporter (DMT)-like permease
MLGAVASGALYYALNRGGSLLQEYQHLNWTFYVLGIAIVGLEAGYIYMYKAGWDINSAQVLCSSLLAIALLLVGYLLYHETITWTKVMGIIICLVGLVFLNK